MGSLYYIPDYLPVTLTGHRSAVVKAFFSGSMEYVNNKIIYHDNNNLLDLYFRKGWIIECMEMG